jgi:hypothetical protein
MKKRQLQKCKGLRKKTSNEKRGNPTNARGYEKRHLIKKEATPKTYGL